MSGNDEIRMTNDDIESALAGLALTAPQIDRDALMYRAGYQAALGLASSRKTIRLWQSSTALMAAASVALAVTLWQRPTPEPLPQFVDAPPTAPSEESIAESEVPQPEPIAVAQTPDLPAVDPLLLADPSKNYLALRAVVLRRGVDAWTVESTSSSNTEAAPSRPSTVRGMMDELLPPPRRTKRTTNDKTNDNLNEASTNREEPVV